MDQLKETIYNLRNKMTQTMIRLQQEANEEYLGEYNTVLHDIDCSLDELGELLNEEG